VIARCVLKVIQVIARIHDEAMGPSYSVPRLADALGQLGAEVHLHVLAPAPKAPPTYRMHPHHDWRFLYRLGISPQMRRALCREAGTTEVIHNHGLWMMPNVYPEWAIRGTACRLVMSPRGMLSAWALQQSVWKKRLMWFLGQERLLRIAHCLHATSEIEYHDIRSAGLRAPVAIIANGVDIPAESSRSAGGPRRLLFLSRVNPKKGIDVLLHAWQRLEPRFPEWELHIVGASDPPGYQGEVEQLARSLGVSRVCFPGPAFGPDKTRQYQQADLFVLPTYSENFGLAVAEALAHGLPAIVTKGAPWSGLETQDCGWWIEQGVDSLTDCLQSALALSPEKLSNKGQRGRQWMERDFSWDHVGRMMFQTYGWLVGGGAPPQWVRLN
jgi:glycosyltransferase involved in cell wall biosynthesis